ncbi:chromate transporter [Streptomyces coeruleoprunus]|uniref:Chromate transporter n=1 Tax=Streptomyces coeruleoprunus TaxID=285563 RepID=A0ABV9XEY7_9ACTN
MSERRDDTHGDDTHGDGTHGGVTGGGVTGGRAAAEVFWVFLRVGALSFGGPAANMALVHSKVVLGLKWLEEREFLDLVGMVTVLPGPNAVEMAMHIGHRRAGRAGFVLGGIAFVLPGAVLAMILGALYVRYGATPAAGGLLYGIKPVVIAVTAWSVIRLAKGALKPRGGGKGGAPAARTTDADPAADAAPQPSGAQSGTGPGGDAGSPAGAPAARAADAHPAGDATPGTGNAAAPGAAAPARAGGPQPGNGARGVRARLVPLGVIAGTGVVYLFAVDELLLLAVAGAVMLAGHLWRTRRERRPAGGSVGMVLPLPLAAAGGHADLPALAGVFLKAGALLFGGGAVLLAVLRGELVVDRGWITEAQLLDAVMVGQVTPGPVLNTATFLGYTLAGPLGGVVVTVAVVLPSFLLMAAAGPALRLIRAYASARAVLDGVTLGAIGVLAGFTVELARGALVDPLTVALAAAAALVLWRRPQSALSLVGAGAVVGLLRLLVHHAF